MITIHSSYGRYFSDFEGQEEALNQVLNRLPARFVLEFKPINAAPSRVWWNVYTPEGLKELEKAIRGLEVAPQVENSAEITENEPILEPEMNLEQILEQFCQRQTLNPAQCRILGFNSSFMLVRLPSEGPRTAIKVQKVNLRSLESTSVSNLEAVRLGRRALADLLSRELS